MRFSINGPKVGSGFDRKDDALGHPYAASSDAGVSAIL